MIFGMMFVAGFAGCIGETPEDAGDDEQAPESESSVVRDDGFFIGCENASIWYQFWIVEKPVAVIFLVHGYGEHTGRYSYVAEHFNKLNMSVYALDHRGHGRSTGYRCNIEDYNYYIEDLQTFVTLVKGIEGHENNYFMLGHSMGGGIAVVYSQRYAAEMDGFIYSAPAVGFAGAPMAAFQAAAALAPVVQEGSPLMSDYETPYVLANSEDLNHDENNTRAYDEDPLVYHGGLKAGMASQLLNLMSYACDNVGSISKPCIFLQGSEDVLVDPNATKEFYDSVTIEDKNYILYDGFYHEVLNEPEWFGGGGKVRVMNDIFTWLDPRIQAT